MQNAENRKRSSHQPFLHSAFCILHSLLMTEPNPPIGKTWPRLYAAVLLALALEIVLFYALTRAFA